MQVELNDTVRRLSANKMAALTRQLRPESLTRKLQAEALGDPERRMRVRVLHVRTTVITLTKSGGLPHFDLQKELEKVADFKSLPPHKIPARLEVGERKNLSVHVCNFAASKKSLRHD